MNINFDNIIICKNNNSAETVENNQRQLQLRKKCVEMEAIFLTQVFKAMERTIPKSSVLKSSNNLASVMFSSVMGKAVAEQGGIGISEILYSSLEEKDNIPDLSKIEINPFLGL